MDTIIACVDTPWTTPFKEPAPFYGYQVYLDGAIDNIEELKKELGFFDHSQEAVLAKGYQVWGTSVVTKLTGSFAFFIWNKTQRSGICARDRMGTKPLCYSLLQGLTVASTMGAFLQLKGFPKQLDFEALRDYLAYQTVFAPHTFLKNVSQLLPAHYLLIKEGQFSLTPYWSLPHPSVEKVVMKECAQRVEEELRTQIKAFCLKNSRPGVLLSGGIDSSLLTYYLSQYGSPKTYTMRFKDPAMDESSFAHLVSQHCHTDHTVLDAEEITSDTFVQAIQQLDQPLADPAYVMCHCLYKQARHEVSSMISSEGADELFGCYAHLKIQPPLDRSFKKRVLAFLAKNNILAHKWWPKVLTGQDFHLYEDTQVGPWKGRKYLGLYVKNIEHYHPGDVLSRWKSIIKDLGSVVNLENISRASLWSYLSENCLVKVHRASSPFALPLAFPFLSPSLVDFTLSLPAEVHYHTYNEGKSILKQIAQSHLPQEIIHRSKHGFSVPFASFYQGIWRKTCDSYIAHCQEIAPFLKADAIQHLWNSALRNKSRSRLAYTFLVLLIWLEKNKLTA